MFSISKKGAGAIAAFAVVLGGVALAPAQAETKTLVIWADDNRGPHLIEVFGTVADQDPGDYISGYVIDVRPQGNFDALKTAWDNSTAASGPDIIYGANDWVPTGAKNGKLAAFTLPSNLKGDFTANQLGDLSYKGKLYGVPLDVNNVAMVRNVGVPKPNTFGDMVTYFQNNKVANGLTAGLCILGGGTSWGGMSVYSALGLQPYRMKAGKIDTTLSKPGKAAASGDPVSASFLNNLKATVLSATADGWTSNGFYAPWDGAISADFNCDTDFRAGKVPYAIMGNWQKNDAVATSAVVATLQPVPGMTAGTFGNAFGSVSGALLTSYANTHGNLAAAKSLLNYIGSRGGQREYQKIEGRPAANGFAAKYGTAFQKGFARSAALASIPQIGSILNGTGGNAWWDLAGNYWYRIAMNNENLTTTTNNLSALLKANIVAGSKF
jgi:arabinogalactan oligomer/maltooligosaccharide transport system substrate-binding protein